jgi:hypothetical protein
MNENLALASFALLFVTSCGILLSRDWRWSIAALAVQYVGVFLMTIIFWPFGIAVIKLVVGWMAGTVLGTTQVGQKRMPIEHSWPASRLFRILAALMVLLLVFSISPQIAKWLPINNLMVLQGGLILFGVGLLQLGMTARPLRVSLGLLTLLAGFEVLYAAVETSLLVAGLLALINLGLALAGAYLLSNAPEEPI